MSVLVGSGWKSISMVDVHQSITFTLWLCGCNLRCPFCHNWRLAVLDKAMCRPLDVNGILDALDTSRLLVDYLHVTGGEPLLQWKSLIGLVEVAKHNMGVPFSLNSNLTLRGPLEKMLTRGLVDHVATDLKAPPELLYGLPVEVARRLWGFFIESLGLVSDYGVPLELRVPVTRDLDIRHVERYVREALDAIRHGRFYVIIQPLLGHPITASREPSWCDEHCNPAQDKLEEAARLIKDMGVGRVVVKNSITV